MPIPTVLPSCIVGKWDTANIEAAQTLGELLAAKRDDLLGSEGQIEQFDIAKAIGFSQSYVSKIERSQAEHVVPNWPSRRQRALLEAYGFSEDEMQQIAAKFNLDLAPSVLTTIPVTPGDRLQKLRTDRGLTRQQVTQRSKKVLRGNRLRNLEEKRGAWESVSGEELNAFAQIYDIDRALLIEAVNGTPYPSKPNVFNDQVAVKNPNLRYGTRKIPKFNFAGMGPGGWDDTPIGYTDIPDYWTGEYFSVDAIGDSMAPQIPDGTELVVRVQPTAEPKDVVLCFTPDDGNLCKIYNGPRDDGLFILTSFNPDYDPIITRELTIRGILWETRNSWKANGRRR